MDTCKFCLKKRKLVKAHIIPRAFFEAIKEGNVNIRALKLKGVTNSKDRFPIKYTTKGFYDPNLVCLGCEQSFGAWDDYGIKMLLKQQGSHVTRYKGRKLVAWQIVDYDYERVMLFFLSILWRAGNSELKEFEKVKLGPYSDMAKVALSAHNPDKVEGFSVFLARFEEGPGRNIIMDPYLDRANFHGLNIYHFHLGAGYILYAKVDKRPLPEDFENLKVTLSNFYILNRGRFEESKDLDVVLKVYDDAEALVKSWKT